jgi:bacterioferritin-associated ferredoxin
MIVCSCHAVSDRELRRLAHAGASPDEIARLTSAGTECGSCAPHVRDVVEAERGGCGKSPPCVGCTSHAFAA